MERLTSWNGDCVQINGHCLHDATWADLVQMADRLARYEDSGLSPEDAAMCVDIGRKHLCRNCMGFIKTAIDEKRGHVGEKGER